MKKVLAILAIGTLTLSANAQKKGSDGFKLCIHAGALSSSGTYEDGNNAIAVGVSSKMGFRVGVGTSFSIGDKLAFAPELNWVSKGMKLAAAGVSGGFPYVVDGKITTNFLEIPLNLAYYFGDGGKGFFAGLGPVISLGMGGTTEQTITYGGASQSSSSSVKFDGKKSADLSAGDKDYHLKMMEFGGNIFAGYKISEDLGVKLQYNIGFSNLGPDDKQTYKTNYFGLTVGYLIMK